jgi:hypothetical protein
MPAITPGIQGRERREAAVVREELAARELAPSRPSSAAATSGSRPARVAKFPVNCVNHLTLGRRKIWEPYCAKLNAT